MLRIEEGTKPTLKVMPSTSPAAGARTPVPDASGAVDRSTLVAAEGPAAWANRLLVRPPKLAQRLPLAAAPGFGPACGGPLLHALAPAKPGGPPDRKKSPPRWFPK